MTRPTRRGFVLIEMLAVLALLAAFGIVSAKLFTSLMRQMRTTAAAQSVAGRLDSALSTLRTDVWSATQLQAQDTTLILTTGAHTVTWLADDKGNLSRTETGAAPVTSDTRRWDNLPARLSFAVNGTVVSVHVTESDGHSDTLPLLSEAATLQSGANP